MHGRSRVATAVVAAVRPFLTRGTGQEARLRGRARRRFARLRVAVVVLACATTVAGLAPAASAAYAVEPVGPSWVPNGGVHAVVSDGTRVYVGGSFTGGVAALDALTGKLIWQGSADGDVRALALTGNGSLLMGGAFNTVGGTTHRKLASVSASTGAVNNTFKGAAGGVVRDIVVVGTTAYFGGGFINHGGMAQQGLGAVDATTGALVTSFTTATNGTVYALGTDGARLFVGGSFTTVNGQPRNYLASVTLSSTTLDAWAPAKACTGCNVIWDLTLGGNRVYTAGRNGGGLYALDKATGATVYKLSGFNGDTQAVTLAPDGKLYVGGHFVTVGGLPRMLVAEFDVSGAKPVLGAFSTRFVTSYPGVWALGSTSSRLYVGGDFTAAGSQVNGKNAFPYFAMFPSDAAPPPDTTAPTVTATSPTAGATGVAAATDVTATFSEPVQGVSGTTFTLTGPGGAVGAAVSLNAAGTVATLNPTADLTAGATYTATLTGTATAIRDLANNPLTPNPTTWTFTVAAPTGDASAPTVTASTPPDGRTGISRTVNPTATFSETVTNVTPATFTLTRTSDGAPVAAREVRFNVTDGRWVFDPSPTLDANTQYTATVTTEVTDLAGNRLAAARTWTFTTGA